jgi:hypothetical protein
MWRERLGIEPTFRVFHRNTGFESGAGSPPKVGKTENPGNNEAESIPNGYNAGPG